MPEVSADSETQDKLKATLWYHIGKVVDEETINLGVNATPQFIGSLAELAWAQLGNVAVDLESFAKHAGRTQINTNDVMLLARRNEGLESILKNRMDKIQEDKAEKTKKR